MLYFFYLPSAEMAKQRVALRISKGGHNIPPDVIKRLYVAGTRYLFEYSELVKNRAVFQNDDMPPHLIAEGEFLTFNHLTGYFQSVTINATGSTAG